MAAWEDDDDFPRPDLAAQAGFNAAMEELVASSNNTQLKGIRNDKSLYYSFQYLISCLKHRITPDAPVAHVTKWEHEEELQEAFRTNDYR